MEYFEWLAARGALAEPERRRLRAWFVFLAALSAGDSCYPADSAMRPLGDPDGIEPTLRGMANQNFYTDVLNIPGMAAQVFPGHPSAAAWRARAVAHWGRQLDHHVYPGSGVWEESHTYYLHVLLTMNSLLKRWRADGVADFYADERMRRLVGASLAQVTPRDALYGGRRHLLAWGDHDARPLAATLEALADHAAGVAAHDPALGAELAWMVAEMGGDIGGRATRAPAWRSAEIAGLGFVFRTGSPETGETLVALRAGAAWGHHHNDDGSLQVFARGRAWVTDACHGHVPARGRRKFAAEGHSRAVPEGVEPANYLWRFARGWICRADAAGETPHAVAMLPTQLALTSSRSWPEPLDRPLLAMRAVVQLAPGLFAVIDEHDGQRPHDVVFHLAAERVAADGPRLRGEAPEGGIELVAVGAGAPEWRAEPPDLPADGDLAKRTWPCRSASAGARWHLTILALLAPGAPGPVVTRAGDGARVEGAGVSAWLRRDAGETAGWTVEKTGGPALRLPFAFPG